MVSRIVSVVLVLVLLHGSLVGQTQPQSPGQTPAMMQQVLRKAQEKDKAVKVTLKQKIDNQRKFSGKVSEISDTSFTIPDQKTGKAMKLAYEDVQQVNQKGMATGAKVAIAVGVIIGVPLIIWAARGAPR